MDCYKYSIFSLLSWFYLLVVFVLLFFLFWQNRHCPFDIEFCFYFSVINFEQGQFLSKPAGHVFFYFFWKINRYMENLLKVLLKLQTHFYNNYK